MNYEKTVTLFDAAQHAEAARRNLESLVLLRAKSA